MTESITRLRSKAVTTGANPADDNWAALQTVPPNVFPMPEGCSKALVTFRMVNGAGVRLANNTTTATVTIVPSSTGVAPGGTAVPLMGDSVPLTTHSMVRPIVVELPPGSGFGVHLSALTSPPATIATLEVWVQPYRG